MQKSQSLHELSDDINPWNIQLFTSDLSPKIPQNLSSTLLENLSHLSLSDELSLDSDSISHQKIADIWSKFGVPEPENILQNTFNLQLDTSSKLDEICNLFDNEILKHATEAGVAGLISYKYEIHSLSTRLVNKKEEITFLLKNLQQNSDKLKKITEEFEETTQTLNSDHQQELDNIKITYENKIATIRKNYEMNIFEEVALEEKFLDEKIKLKDEIKALKKSNEIANLDLTFAENKVKSTAKDFAAAIDEIESLKEQIENQKNWSKSRYFSGVSNRSGGSSLLKDGSNHEMLEEIILDYEHKIADLMEKVECLEEEKKEAFYSPMPVQAFSKSNPTDESTPQRPKKSLKKSILFQEPSFADEIVSSLGDKLQAPKKIEMSEISTQTPEFCNETQPKISEEDQVCCGSCKKWKNLSNKLESKILRLTDEKQRIYERYESTRAKFNQSNKELKLSLKDYKKSMQLSKKLLDQNEKLSSTIRKLEDKKKMDNTRSNKLASALKNLVDTTSSVYNHKNINEISDNYITYIPNVASGYFLNDKSPIRMAGNNRPMSSTKRTMSPDSVGISTNSRDEGIGQSPSPPIFARQNLGRIPVKKGQKCDSPSFDGRKNVEAFKGCDLNVDTIETDFKF